MVDPSDERGAGGAAPGGSRGDADGDGVPDVWNQRAPALAFVCAMAALVPTLFAMRSSIYSLRGETTGRGGAMAWNVGTIVLATATIIVAAYGANARTRGLARSARYVAVGELVVSIAFTMALFFQKR